VPGEPVCENAAEEDEQDLRHRGRRQYEAEVGRRAGQVEDAERQRNRCNRGPEQRDGLARE
jgi:hypothetical protein